MTLGLRQRNALLPLAVLWAWLLGVAAAQSYTIVYTVQQGDTLTKIAQSYGLKEEDIRSENRISGNGLSVGQSLTITLEDTFPFYPDLTPPILPPKILIYQTGLASWYGPGFHGRLTASGTRYNMYAMTAAHRRLPFGTMVRVTNLSNGRSVIVKINDRGPYISGRVIDLSYTAARALGFRGLARVNLEIVR